MCFIAYAHTSRPPEPCPQKRYFLTSGVVKNVSFYAFLDYQNHVLKNYILTSGVVKNVFLCISRPPESSP